MELLPGLLDGPEDIVLDHRVAVAIVGPGVGGCAIGAGIRALRPAQGDGNEISATQSWGQTKRSFLVAAVAVKENNQGVWVIWLVTHRQESGQRLGARSADIKGIKAFRGTNSLFAHADLSHVNPLPRMVRFGVAWTLPDIQVAQVPALPS